MDMQAPVVNITGAGRFAQPFLRLTCAWSLHEAVAVVKHCLLGDRCWRCCQGPPRLTCRWHTHPRLVSISMAGLCWAGLGWGGLGWVGLGLAGVGWAGVGWAGLGWCRTAQHNTTQCSAMQCSAVRCGLCGSAVYGRAAPGIAAGGRCRRQKAVVVRGPGGVICWMWCHLLHVDAADVCGSGG